MFSNIKRKIKEYFTKEKSEMQKQISIEVAGINLKDNLKETNTNAFTVEDLSMAISEAVKKLSTTVENVSKAITTEFKNESKEEDHKRKLQRKLQLIAKRTKSGRIRKKNLKRLVKLFDNC